MFKNIFGKIVPPASIRKGVHVGNVFHLYDDKRQKINSVTVTEIYVMGNNSTIIAFQFADERATVSTDYKKFCDRVAAAEKMLKAK